jgi:hypothetical protein
MGRNSRIGGYRATQAAAARRRSETASKKVKSESNKPNAAAETPASATPVPKTNPYARLIGKIAADRQGNKS